MNVPTHTERNQLESELNLDGPGRRLQKQRMRLGLEQSTVAAQLHLNLSVIESIEQEDYDALPGLVFVKGYLRNYAKLVGIPDEEILDALLKHYPAARSETIDQAPKVSLKPEIKSDHQVIKWVSWVVVLGLIGLAVLWWVDEYGLQPLQPNGVPGIEMNGETTQPASEIMDPDVPAMDFEQAATEPMMKQPSIPSEPEILPEPTAVVIEQVEPDVEVIPEPAPIVQEETAPVEQILMPQPEPANLAPQTVVSPAPLVEPTQPAEVAQSKPESRLVFRFTGRCWTEVRNASGRALIIGEMKDGVVKTIEASQGPFKITLGDVRVVSLSIDGESFDFTPYLRGNVARFNLDPEQL